MAELSKAYATALFSLAAESGAERDYAAALETVAEQFRANPAYVELLASPAIPRQERTDAIAKVFSGSLPEQVVFFLQLLCEKGHIRSFEDCVTEYRTLLDAAQHIAVANVVSAVPLTAEEQAKLQRQLEKRSGDRVILHCTTDAALLGGMIVEIDGKVMDGSLRHRLQEVKSVMSK